MQCFDKLQQSRFLTNVTNELQKAAYVLHFDDTKPAYIANKKIAKELYYTVGNVTGLFQYLYDDQLTKDNIGVVKTDTFLFMYTRSKRVLTDNLTAHLYCFGDLPMYKTKHTINGKIVHAALIHLGFHIYRPSTN